VTVSGSAGGGLTAAQITGNGAGVVTLQGAIHAINATLAAGVTYIGNLNFNGTDTLTVAADDLGNTGAGGAKTNTRSISIHVLSAGQQIARLRNMMDTLYAAGTINQGQANSFTKKLEHALAAAEQGKTAPASNMIRAFRNEFAGMFRPGTSDPLLAQVDLLLLSMERGG
jgi:hypothetical protein